MGRLEGTLNTGLTVILTCSNANEMEIISAFYSESNSNFWIVIPVLVES